jgi:hypothetical protein
MLSFLVGFLFFGGYEDNLIFQLEQNKRILENRMNYSCDYFAWTYGLFEHFSEDAVKIALKYHPYIYSGTNYQNYFSYSNQVFNRRQLEPFWQQSHIKFFLSFSKIH